VSHEQRRRGVLAFGAGPSLGRKPGWRFESMVPASDLVLGAHGAATTVQDDLDNTYQKLD
jgi:hypothetical protein